MKNRPSFEEWLRQVDRVLSATIGLSHLDLDDCPYRDWYDDHVSATVAASRAKRRMTRRHYLPPPNTRPKWHVTVLDKDGYFIAHSSADDEKECQAIATQWRSENLSTKIWIKSPFGRAFPWA